MIEKILNVAEDHADADQIAREQDNELSRQERFSAFMKLIEPYYADAEGLQRVCELMIDANVRFVMIGGRTSTKITLRSNTSRTAFRSSFCRRLTAQAI